MNTLRDVQYALRTFARAPLAALTVVMTVAVGLGVVAVLVTILNALLFRVDQVPDVDEMYSIERTVNGAPSPFTRPGFEAMRAGTQVFRDAYATVTEVDLHVDGRRMAVTLVSGNFFQVVRVNPIMGRPLLPTDDERSGGHAVVVLSDKGWDRHFNRDPNVLGRTVLVSGKPFAIIGVTPAGFRGLEANSPDVWAPLSQLPAFRPADRGRDDRAAVEIVGRLAPGVSQEQARAQLATWDSLQSGVVDRRSTSPANIALQPRRGTIPQPMEAVAVFAPLFVACGLILMIGCANVANLLLARGVARQREIGIRLSLGASRRRIVRQLMTESVLLALAAAAGGYLISRIVLRSTVYWTMRSAPVDIGDVNLSVPAADWRVALFLVVAAVAATGFFALLPALHATRINPQRTLRGELVKDARPGRARNALVGVQVFASALLLICASIFLRSAIASARVDPGIRTADTVLVDIGTEPTRAAMTQAVASDPTVIAYAAVRPQLLAPLRVAFADAGAGRSPVVFKSVSSSYFDVLDIPIVRGRPFTASEREHHQVAIVSESVARLLWPDRSGVGETFRLEPDAGIERPEAFLRINPDAPIDNSLMQARVVTVVGVARDVRGFRFTGIKEAGVFLPTGLDAANTSIVARVQGDPARARQALLDHLTPIDPNMGIITMRTVARLELFLLQFAFWVSLVLGGLALLLTVSGLFSVLSYLVEQRTREIGVRMALGASSGAVTRLMLAQTTRPVMAGLIAGTGLAATLAAALLASPAGALISPIVHVTDPVAYLASLGVIVAACLLAAWIPAARAAQLDPMRTLRRD